MKPILLKNVRKGEFFTLTNDVKYNEDGEVLSKYVYIREEYERSEKKYWVGKFDNINNFKLMKGDRIVFIDFFF